MIRPIITEKSMRDAADKKYTFQVDIKSNKIDIKVAVEKAFPVKVVSVKTLVMPGRKFRKGKKWQFGVAPEWKKAIVEIKKDQKIDLFEVSHDK